MKTVFFKASAIVLFALSLDAGAVLQPANILAASITSLPVAGKAPELCVIPAHFTEGKYSKKDVARESELCAYSIDQNVAACGKTNSTNPGVNFESSDTASIGEMTRANCEIEDAKKLAKYKNSTSCSYTPSLLSYYHVSRMLGNIANVPVAVLRTMDLDRHKEIATRTMGTIKDHDSLIYKTWTGLKGILDKGSSSSKADLIFVEGFQQTYGALQRNPRGEEFYTEFFNRGTDRAVAFRDNNPIYKNLIKKTLDVDRQLNAENVQKFVQLKDAGEMILLDYILNQQDRFGNAHYKDHYYYSTTSKKDGSFKLKNESDLADVPEELRAGALTIKQLMLKDNDCGVTKDNKAKKAGLLDPIAHMDPSTYKRLLELNATLEDADIKDLFVRGMQFTEDDFKSVAANIHEATQKLQASCKSGKLALDLDIDLYFSSEPLPTAYTCD